MFNFLFFMESRVNPVVRVGQKEGSALYHSPCPLCGGNDRFIILPEQEGKDLCKQHGILGTWACPRHCKIGGDVIDYFMKIEGLSFAEACKEIGIELDQTKKNCRKYKALVRPDIKNSFFTPREYEKPNEKWIATATKLMNNAHDYLLTQETILAWLNKRGLDIEGVKRYRLGYLEGEDKSGKFIYRHRSAFGLPLLENNGKKMTALCIPRGVTIPLIGKSKNKEGEIKEGLCLRLRIRKRNADIDKNNPHDCKYLLVKQEIPYSAPMILYPKTYRAETATWVIVESELDAMTVHHACEEKVGVMAVLTVGGKPDVTAHNVLLKAQRILVSLDFDTPRLIKGKQSIPAADVWPWWQKNYTQARLWPVPLGKDPGEAFVKGVNLKKWIDSALPYLFELSSHNTLPVKEYVQPISEINTQEPKVLPHVIEGVTIPEYLPLHLIPADVLTLAKMWKGKPIFLTLFNKERDGRTGWKWDYNNRWRVNHQEEFEIFMNFQDKSKEVWHWFDQHLVFTQINESNFLKIFG